LKNFDDDGDDNDDFNKYSDIVRENIKASATESLRLL
jgi:hypothetical protein